MRKAYIIRNIKYRDVIHGEIFLSLEAAQKCRKKLEDYEFGGIYNIEEVMLIGESE